MNRAMIYGRCVFVPFDSGESKAPELKLGIRGAELHTLKEKTDCDINKTLILKCAFKSV